MEINRKVNNQLMEDYQRLIASDNNKFYNSQLIHHITFNFY